MSGFKSILRFVVQLAPVAKKGEKAIRSQFRVGAGIYSMNIACLLRARAKIQNILPTFKWKMPPLSAVVLAIFVAISTPSTARAEPITIGLVLLTIGGGIVVAIVSEEVSGPTYVNIAHGYATPTPDSHLVWTVGRRNPASAFDTDFISDPISRGKACANAGFIYDTIDASQTCDGAKAEGAYYNAARIFKDGELNEADTSTPRPTGLTRELVTEISNLPADMDVRIDMHTGQIGSYDALVGGGRPPNRERMGALEVY